MSQAASRPPRGQHNPRLAWTVGGAIALAAVLGFGGLTPGGDLDLWHRLTGPEIDGGWIVETIDGKPAPDRLALGIRWGEVTGGYDGCNHWSFDQQDDGEGPDRSIISTLQYCEPVPGTEGYMAVARYTPVTRMIADDRLRMEALGYTVVLRRARDGERFDGSADGTAAGEDG